ncbi:hypothetical protein FIBSPDRAFT_956593 [Athelia psychrophila]|uniref:Uncharacterized protein n=1 Tax=Athelia psychrophila TaxID=1759441 RepID=A0A166GP46_9AGAM|nr:hypothetical protein FIBSPDRAFT_956593 [Fibularhizoctonia sp. CBS 109695]
MTQLHTLVEDDTSDYEGDTSGGCGDGASDSDYEDDAPANTASDSDPDCMSTSESDRGSAAPITRPPFTLNSSPAPHPPRYFHKSVVAGSNRPSIAGLVWSYDCHAMNYATFSRVQVPHLEHIEGLTSNNMGTAGPLAPMLMPTTHHEEHTTKVASTPVVDGVNTSGGSPRAQWSTELSLDELDSDDV